MLRASPAVHTVHSSYAQFKEEFIFHVIVSFPKPKDCNIIVCVYRLLSTHFEILFKRLNRRSKVGRALVTTTLSLSETSPGRLADTLPVTLSRQLLRSPCKSSGQTRDREIWSMKKETVKPNQTKRNSVLLCIRLTIQHDYYYSFVVDASVGVDPFCILFHWSTNSCIDLNRNVLQIK